MSIFDCRIFHVSKKEKMAKPVEAAPMTEKADTIDKARKALRERLKVAGEKVRGIAVAPNDAGKPSLVAYVWKD